MTRHSSILEVTDYRLDPLREVRRLDERTKQGELADASKDERATAAVLAAATARCELIAAQIQATPRAAVTANELAVIERFLARRRAELDAARVDLARARAAHERRTEVVDAARVRLVHARAQKEVIERHFSRWRDTQRKILERKEE